MKKRILLKASLLTFLLSAAVSAGNLMDTVEEGAQVRAVRNEEGVFLFGSDHIYCTNKELMPHNEPAIHYLSGITIRGEDLEGYYYHDESGQFLPAEERLQYMDELSCGEQLFNGYYWIGNLGRICTGAQVRLLDNVEAGDRILSGIYFFTEEGRLMEVAGEHEIHEEVDGIFFDGNYFFDGVDGSLKEEDVEKAKIKEEETVQNVSLTPTPAPTPIPEGSTEDPARAEERHEELEKKIREAIDQSGLTVAVHLTDLENGDEIRIGEAPMNSASLIKSFVMEYVYSDYDHVLANAKKKYGYDTDEKAKERLTTLLTNMITISDNESFNELVRLLTDSFSFKDGAVVIDAYLEKQGYAQTTVQHTLSPSPSVSEGLGGSNTTSTADCSMLLERVYSGRCVSQEASEEMLELLKGQKTLWKIPAGLPKGTVTANKTGENDRGQHDMCIVYGPDRAYILCVMTTGFSNSNSGASVIVEISKRVYEILNPPEEAAAGTAK